MVLDELCRSVRRQNSLSVLPFSVVHIRSMVQKKVFHLLSLSSHPFADKLRDHVPLTKISVTSAESFKYVRNTCSRIAHSAML